MLVTSKIKLEANSDAKALLAKGDQPVFLSMWHGKIFVLPKMIYQMANVTARKIRAVTSTHTDGQYVESFLSRFNIQAIRGSSNRGGFGAINQVIKSIKSKDIIAITPDGPKGPRHECNGNIHNIALKYNIPIVPMCFAASKAKVFNSWDRFMLPLPFSTIYVDMGAPINFGKNCSTIDAKASLIKMMKQQEYNVEKKAKNFTL